MEFRTAGVIFSVVILCIYKVANGNDGLTITYGQKLILDKFKETVVNKLPHDYMKQDVYLIRWLRARSFNLKESERMLMEDMYPYQINSVDKEGKPVLTADPGQYDLRAAGVSGKFPRLVKYAEKMAEHLSVEIRRMQDEGKNVTKGVVLADIEGFNLVQHACPQCLFFFFQFYSSFEQHHPGLLDKAIIVNASQIFQALFQALADRLLPETRDIIRLYSRDRRLYSKELLKYINRDQLPEKYGGSRN